MAHYRNLNTTHGLIKLIKTSIFLTLFAVVVSCSSAQSAEQSGNTTDEASNKTSKDDNNGYTKLDQNANNTKTKSTKASQEETAKKDVDENTKKDKAEVADTEVADTEVADNSQEDTDKTKQASTSSDKTSASNDKTSTGSEEEKNEPQAKQSTVKAGKEAKKDGNSSTKEATKDMTASADATSGDDMETKKKAPEYKTPEISIPQKFMDEFDDSVTVSLLKPGLASIHKTIDSDIAYLRFSIDISPSELAKDARLDPYIAAALITKGSSKYPRQKLIEATEKYAISLSCSPSFNCSNAFTQLQCSMTVDKEYIDEGLDVFSSVILEPSFDQEEYDIVVKNAKAAISSSCKSSLSTQVNSLVNTIYYDMAHPYYSTHEELQQTLERTSKAKVENNYYRLFLNGRRSSIISLTSIPAKYMDQKLNTRFDKLNFWYSKDKSAAIAIRNPKPSKEDVVVQHLENAGKGDTAYAVLKSLVPGKRSPAKVNVGLAILHRILNAKVGESVRSKHSLSYAPHAVYSAGELGHSYLEVSTLYTKKALQLMVDEIKKLQTQKLDRDELNEYRNFEFTVFYYRSSSPDFIASNIAHYYHYYRDINSYINYPVDISKITPTDIQELAQKYLKNYKLALIGSKEVVGKAEDYQAIVDQLK
ncbi:MAG: insulinase family protein [Proteobacteria bacterium]|nr:insulinase family protein [Pseudomonadota bacterium]